MKPVLLILLAVILPACAGPTLPTATTQPAHVLMPTSPPQPATGYQLTPLANISRLVDCSDKSGADEACLPDGYVRLVGYLYRPTPEVADLPDSGTAACACSSRAGRRKSVSEL